MKDNTFLKIGFNTFTQTTGKIISAVLSAATIFLLTRYLGVSGYGNFALVFAYLTFFLAFTDFGFQSTIVNKLSKKEIGENEIFGTYLFLKIAVILIMTLVSLVVLIFMPYSLFVKAAIVFSSIGVGVGALGGFGNTFFQYQLRLEFVGILDVLNRFVTFGLLFFFVVLKLNFFYILSSVLISNIFCIFLMFLILRKIIQFKFSFDKKLAYKIFKDSLPIGFAGFLTITYFKMDTIMLSYFKPSSEVGIYSLAYNIFEDAIVLWAFYMASFFPFLSKYYHQNKTHEYSKLIRNAIVWALLFSMGILVLGLLFSTQIIRIFSGTEFQDASVSLKILLFSSFFIFINSIFYNIFFIKGKTRFIIVSLIASLIFNFLINLYFIPRFGYIGASLTTVITEIFLFTIYIIMNMRIKK
jgi:O-antigen/teichoic acid export membrane protein